MDYSIDIDFDQKQFWDSMFGIREPDYGKFEMKEPHTIQELVEMGKLLASRDFGLCGYEDLYGIAGESGKMQFWFTVKRGSFERINWLSLSKSAEFTAHSAIDQMFLGDTVSWR